MPKSIAGAYAIAGTAIAIAIIVVAGSTVGVFGGGRQTMAAAEAAAQPALTQSRQAIDSAAATPGSAPVGGAESDTRGEREHEEDEHEEREHPERGRAERTGFLGFLRNGDD